MTLQLRPTFSESWYRVQGLKVRLRPSAQISRTYYRGERWYVVRDPAGNQFHRLSDPAYRFVALLDGTRTVEQAWELAGGQLADDAPTQPEVIQILSHLFAANLIDADVTPDATVLLRRHKQLSKRKMQGRLMNMLFPRIPIWDPDRFLKRWMPLVRQMFSRVGAVVWLVVLIAAIAVVGPMWDEPGHSLKNAAEHAIDIRNNPINLFWLWAVFVFIKLIHELGHAFACRRFGGECHELGIMFLVFVPTPYVDASTAWSFSSRWERIFVGAAGMIVELFFASLMAFVWATTHQGELINQLAFNAMLVASVTTIIFNANPLLRYDGYYILSDFLEIPNLRQKSSDYSLGLIKRHLFTVKLTQPLPPPLQRVWLLLYAITSSIYRTFIGVVIIIYVAFQIPVLGVLMALGGVATWIVVPVFKTFKYLAIEPELHRKRPRATLITLGFATAVVIVIGMIPFSVDITQTGITEPGEREVLHAEYPGFVREIRVKDGDLLHKGDVIVVCENRELEKDLGQAQAQLRGYRVKLTAAIADDAAEAGTTRHEVEIAQRRVGELLDRKNDLTVVAPLDGLLVAPDLHNLQDKFLHRGQEIATVAQTDRLLVRTLLEQKESQLVLTHRDDDPKKWVPTEIRMAGDIHTILKGGQPLPMGAASRDVAHPSLTSAAGEETPVDPRDPSKSQLDEFEVGVPVLNPNGKYVAGQRAYVRFLLRKEPLLWQWKRRFLQLIQTKSNSPWV